MKMRLGGFVDFSTVDYSGHVAFMIFMAGCNFRCPYCQNASLIPANSGKEFEAEEVKNRVRNSCNFIDAVGFSGGEPALQPDGVSEICSYAKKIGLKTFLNTNGSNPTLMQVLADRKLIDYVAIDLKAPLEPEAYGRVVGLKEVEPILKNVEKTLGICLERGIAVEARTTIVPNLIHDDMSIRKISRKAGKCKVYVLQQFSPLGDILDRKLKDLPPPSREDLLRLAKVALQEGLKDVRVRTREAGEERVEL